jgi:hypothetical protein
VRNLVIGLLLAVGTACLDSDTSDSRCQAILLEYEAALPGARTCAAGETCSMNRPLPHPAGLACATLVSDAGAPVLDELLSRYDDLGCARLRLPCPLPLDPAACADGVCP